MSRTRISRTLIALLVVTIILGAVAYFHNPSRTKANEQAKSSGAAAVDNAKVTQGPVAPAPVTPPGPPTRPTQIALGNAATRALISQTPGGATPPAGAAAAPANARTGTEAPKPAAPVAAKSPDKPAAASDKPAAPAAVSGSGAITQGKSLIEANDLLAGRNVLNEALLSGKLSPADAQAARDLIAKANQTLVFSPRRVADDPWISSYTVQPGDKPMKIAAKYDVTWEFLGRLNNISDPRKLRAGSTLKVVRGPFHAIVTKSKFTMDLFLGSPGEKGSVYINTFRVGLGKHNSTPPGTWMVSPQSKLKNPKWWGTADEPAREADDPKNPLGEFWIGLTGTDGDAVGKQGFGIHGTIEPDSIGKEASHGCIRLLAPDIERIYEVLMEGKSTVIVKE